MQLVKVPERPNICHIFNSLWCKDVKNDTPKCSIHKHRNTDTQLRNRLLQGPPRFICLVSSYARDGVGQKMTNNDEREGGRGVKMMMSFMNSPKDACLKV